MRRFARDDEEALAYCVSAMLHVVLIAALCVGAVLGLKVAVPELRGELERLMTKLEQAARDLRRHAFASPWSPAAMI
jgi:hypothetical protein